MDLLYVTEVQRKQENDSYGKRPVTGTNRKETCKMGRIKHTLYRT